jgi:hypothetical protein
MWGVALGAAVGVLTLAVVKGILHSGAGAPEPLSEYVGLIVGTLAFYWAAVGERPTLASLQRNRRWGWRVAGALTFLALCVAVRYGLR